MFKGIKSVYRAGMTTCYLIDDDFEEETPYTTWVEAIIYVYNKRHLPVIPNLLKYFYSGRKSSQARQLIMSASIKTNECYPYLLFKEKYYPCLMNQVRKLEFIGK